MNVLSLFDGISCGRVALDRAGVKYDGYFASEIDKHALVVAKKNYSDTQFLGDVTELNGKKLPKISLLIGGSPCQGFSAEGKQLYFSDHRSKLFFEFVRLLEELRPTFFLLENVVMKKDASNLISNLLGVKPLVIDSNLFSAQNRKRLYWTNIPNIEIPTQQSSLTFADVRVLLEDDVYWKDYQVEKLRNREYVREDYYRFVELNEKVSCLLASGGLNRQKEAIGERIRLLNPVEWEKLQTLPVGYTESISRAQRYKTIGNGWTVDVIAHILRRI